MKRFDVIVLGAGMVGIATALHLLDRGRQVALVDRRGPAEETSYGNAGLIQCEAVTPYAFPRDPMVWLGVLLGRRTDARLDWRALPAVAPWLLGYARASSAAAVARTAAANASILPHALGEHRALMARAQVGEMLTEGGYLRIFHTEGALSRAVQRAEDEFARYGVRYEVLDRPRLTKEEPHLSGELAGAVLMPEPARVSDPQDVALAYARLFASAGEVLRGDATTLRAESAGWSVTTEAGVVAARDVVVALGPWSGELLARQGVRIPLGVKRGYHVHLRPRGNALLHRLVVDEAAGFVMTPNKRGIRVTTGAEFAQRDDPPCHRQLERVLPLARALVPLGEALDTPWLGARPCLPDLLPIIGPVPGREGLWANFGHHHLGFTLGPATGRLLAEMMVGQAPFADPRPFSASRF